MPWIATLVVPLSYFVAWAWVSHRSERLGVEAAKAILIAVPLTFLAVGLGVFIVPDRAFLLLEQWQSAYARTVLVPLPLAILGTATLVCSLAVLWGGQWRRATPRPRNPMTRPVVMGFTAAVVVGLLTVLYLSAYTF